ncbi:hypothetical protein NIA71_04630 [Ihubacter massiliensis]|uniref:Uncharacterized protein n=1 Tax=Hominibacterium faecale TaxID=2839743 RepID=A0A9J6QVM4_9FIRM|nr:MULTISPECIES: hypothetical protein [Eubacteriales Family XIII. Incertae Sedis]MCO7121236.1 hypothetical protein [Ihubacter massiliensis]MCU7378222.1 hypothetical protein [Hominibacterium faecale]
MNKYELIKLLRKNYNSQEHFVRLTFDTHWTLYRMLNRLGVGEILFYPEKNGEGFLDALEYIEGDFEPEMAVLGTAEIHDIPFKLKIKIEDIEKGSLAFYLSYEGEPIPFPAFAESFVSLRIADEGYLEYTEDSMLKDAAIKKMDLQVDEHNLNVHGSTYIWNAIFDLSACEELWSEVKKFMSKIEPPAEWLMEGAFYYSSKDDPLCRLDVTAKSVPFPGECFVMATENGVFVPDRYYLRINTHIVDDSNFDNYAEKIQKTAYVTEVCFGFVFLLPNGKSSEEVPYGAECSFMRESPKELCLLSMCCEHVPYRMLYRADDAFLCHILGLMPGRFIKDVEEWVEYWYLSFGNRIDEIKDMAMSLYCLLNEDTGCYELEMIYFRINYVVKPRFKKTMPFELSEYETEIEGCLTEADLQVFHPQNINFDLGIYQDLKDPEEPEDETDLKEGTEGMVLFSHVVASPPKLSLPGLILQIDLESQFFRMEVAPPIGTSITAPDSDAADWNPGFAMLPGSGDIKVIYFLGEGSLQDQEMQIILNLDTSAALKFNAGKLTFTVEEIGGYLNYSPQNTGIGLHGVLRFTLDSSFDLALMASYEKTEDTEKGIWTFEAALREGNIPLAEIINSITGWSLSLELDVDRLDIRCCTDGSYLFDCSITAGFPIFGSKLTISVRGRIAKAAQAENPDILLEGQLLIQYFRFQAKIHLLEDGSKKYFFSVLFDSLELEAFYETNHAYERARLSAEEEGGVLTILLKNFTIGGILRALMRVLRPNVNFKLQKPWDLLNRIGFPEIHILFDTATRDISVTLPMDIDLLILQIQEVGFTYVKREGDKEAKFHILVKYDSILPIEASGGRMLDSGGAYYLWDAFHDSAPGPVSAQEKKKFELKYFGLGRHIDLGLQGAADQSLFALLDICREHVKETAELPTKIYDDSYGWFVGARFTVLEFLEAGILFYDPVLYGIQAKVLNNDLVPLKGLDLTIYYRKVTEDIGVFYANVTLPDCIRNMDFGALSVTLPSIEVWVYTNGNFKINFGFPENDDFSLSFALSYGIFYGRGGFYFGYLNGDTSANAPDTKKGYFDPVIELGIGITVGVGKRLSLGILKLSASLELSGIFEGVFARFVSADGKVTATYYRCRGTVIIAGEIAGEIDFFIIKAGFRLYARVAVTALLESGKATEVALEASFEVSAYIKIWIFKISFEFSYTYRDTFVLGSPSPVPWQEEFLLLDEEALSYDWTPGQILPEICDLEVWLLPYFTKDERRAVWSRMASQEEAMLLQGAGSNGEKHRIAILASYERGSITDLLDLLCGFALGAQKRPQMDSISQGQLKELLSVLEAGCSGFAAENLCELLRLNLRFLFEKAAFSVTDSRKAAMEEACGGEADHVPMPLPPILTLIWETLEEDQSYSSLSFDLSRQEYAAGLFCEYFLLITKTGLQRGLSWMQEQGREEVLCSELTDGIRGQADAVSGMVSRFLLSGPRPEGMPLYEAAFQQFTGLVPAGRAAECIVHRLHVQQSVGGPLLNAAYSEDLTIEIAEADLKYPQNPLNIQFQKEPSLLPFYSKEHCPILLHDRQDVYQEDKPVFSLWRAPVDLSRLAHLDIRVGGEAESCDFKKEDSLSYCRCFLLRLEIRKARDTDMVYSIVSVDEESRAQLQALAKGTAALQKTRLLFSRELKNTSETRPAGAYSMDEDDQSDLVLIRRNLSEITTAPVALDRNGTEDHNCVSFDNLQEALKLLNHMALIGGEGHYIGIGKKPLPTELFEDNGHAVINLLIETEDAPDAPVICLGAGTVGSDEVPIIDNQELPMKSLQRVKPDEYGFSFTLKQMDTVYGQFVYRLDGEDSPPITPQETEGLAEGESYYTHVFSLKPNGEPQALPLAESNPYTRVLPTDYEPDAPASIQKAELSFGFRDIAGNRTAAGDDYRMKEPFAILYHDRLFALTELPSTQASYCFKDAAEHRALQVELCLRCAAEPEPQTVQGILEQTARAYYQYSCADTAFSLRLSFGEYEAASQTFTKAQKEAVTGYLLQLYQYLKEGQKELRPMDVKLAFSFVCPVPESPQSLLCLPVAVTASVKRDQRYAAAGLAEAWEIPCKIQPDKNLEASCAAFEASVPGGKLMLGEGLYGAFFPKHTLCAAPGNLRSLFYSIPPLSVHLMSRSDMELTTVAQRLSGLESGETVSYYQIDLDLWAARFLGFFERLLAPQALSCLFAEDVTEQVDELLEVKRQLAQTIARRTESLFAGGDSEANQAASEALRDYLEKDLGRGYGASGCAAYPVSQSLGQRYALDGSLKNAHGVLGCKFTDCSYGTFVADPADPAAADSISMEQAAYVFTHLEDREEQTWYRFLQPFEQFGEYVQVDLSRYEDARPVVLPVPLRRYPSAPRLLGQQAAASGCDYKNPAWQYELATECALSSQDRLHVLTHTEAEEMKAGNSGSDLYSALAQFIFNEDEYEELLFGEAREYPLTDVLEDFRKQSLVICSCWGKTFMGKSIESGMVLAAEYEEGLLRRIRITEHHIPQGIPLPTLVITDREQQSCVCEVDPDTMTYSIKKDSVRIGPADVFRLQVQFRQIPLRMWQAISCGLYLKRNEVFSAMAGETEPLAVRPDFIYETAPMGFSELLHPALRFSERIAVGSWSVERALAFVGETVGYADGLRTELLLSLGQRAGGADGPLLFRPLARRIPHVLTPDTAEAFFRHGEKSWQDKGIAGKGLCHVKLTLRQYPAVEEEKAAGAVLMEIDDIVFDL